MHSQIDLDNIDENNIRKDTINLGKHWDTTRKVFIIIMKSSVSLV